MFAFGSNQGCVRGRYAREMHKYHHAPDIESVTQLLTVGPDEKSPAARLRKVGWTATTSRGLHWLHLDEAASFYLACNKQSTSTPHSRCSSRVNMRSVRRISRWFSIAIIRFMAMHHVDKQPRSHA